MADLKSKEKWIVKSLRKAKRNHSSGYKELGSRKIPLKP
jgi:hypothetical protein